MELNVKLGRKLIAAITLICYTSGDTSGPGWYYCHGDICDTEIEFCSESFKHCRACKDVMDDCFMKAQINCSSTCIKHQVEKQIMEAKERQCAALKPILHGHHNGSLRELHNQGDVIEFTCDTSYRLIGTRFITCKEYGEWTTGTANCEEVTCPLLQNVKNGKHNGFVSPFKPGDKIVTSCAYGHQLFGKNSTTCTSNGLWTNPLPRCEKITCSNLHRIKHGSWSHSQNYGGKYQTGESVRAACDKKYIMDGAQQWTCSHDGNWKSQDGLYMPVCLLVVESLGKQICMEGWIGVLLFMILSVSVCINIVGLANICRQRQIGQKRIKQEDDVKMDDHLEDEYTKFISNEEEDIFSKNAAISLSDQKHIRERIVRPGTELPPANTPSVKNETERSLTSPESSKSEAGLVMVTIVTTNNNNNNIVHGSTDSNMGQQPPPQSAATVDDTHRPETQPETKLEDRTPVEETGTVQPEQPESSEDNTNLKNAEPGEAYGNGISSRFPVEQTVNNEQDIAQKVILPDTEINIDDINNR